MIQGDRVHLRIVTAADLTILTTWMNDLAFNSEYNTFGLRRADSVEKNFAESGMMSPLHGELLIVIETDTVVGSISYHQTRYGPNEGSIAYNIGLSIAPEYRGKGYGTEAQKLLAKYLFSTYPIMRVEATTDVENIAEQKSLEKAGFTREGVIRQAQWRTGSWHDMVVYSKLRGE